MTQPAAARQAPPNWHERVAGVLWYAHPARPGPQYAALMESQWWSRDRIEALQVSRLQRLVRIASRVPFYRDRFRDAGVGSENIRMVDDIRKLPILEREDLQKLGVEGLRVPGSWGMRASSSGSTSTAVSFLWPLEQMRWLDAGEARARVWLGSDVGTRRLEVRCRPVGTLQTISATLLNTAAFHAPVVADHAEVRRLAQALEAKPPALIWGVSNALYVLAVALLEGGRSVRAGACWSGGNHLHPHYRKAFERAFDCAVYERYASMETGLVAHECVEARSLHVPAEGVIVEIVDEHGKPVAPHQTGDVIVTCLHNTATPLIRYRLGDRAVAPDGRPCVCGRGLPVFGKVAGRAHDFLRRANGALVSPGEAVAAANIGGDSVIDLQVVQSKDRQLRILVVQRESATLDTDRERLVGIFARLVQPPERPSIERVDSIPLTPGGKLRTLVAER